MSRFAAVLAVAVLAAVPAFADQDQATWIIQGRINSVATTAFPDGNSQINVTINSEIYFPEEYSTFPVQTTFTCSDWISCTSTLLGSCAKHSVVTVQTTPEGTTTTTTWQCNNPTYADCWKFTGYMNPHLRATTETTGASCLF